MPNNNLGFNALGQGSSLQRQASYRGGWHGAANQAARAPRPARAGVRSSPQTAASLWHSRPVRCGVRLDLLWSLFGKPGVNRHCRPITFRGWSPRLLLGSVLLRRSALAWRRLITDESVRVLACAPRGSRDTRSPGATHRCPLPRTASLGWCSPRPYPLQRTA